MRDPIPLHEYTRAVVIHPQRMVEEHRRREVWTGVRVAIAMAAALAAIALAVSAWL